MLTLKENMCLSADKLGQDEKKELREFTDWILSIKNGEIFDLTFQGEWNASLVKIPSALLLDPGINPIAIIMSVIYPGIDNDNIEASYFRERAIVTLKNDIINEINNLILDCLPKVKCIYLSINNICKSFGDNKNIDLLYPVKFINQLNFNNVSSYALSLKIETPIILLRNINPLAGLCNGTRLIVTQLVERVIEAQIITGSNIGSYVFILGIVFSINDGRCPFTIKWRRFPIKSYYVMVINKNRGQSLKIIGVLLKE